MKYTQLNIKDYPIEVLNYIDSLTDRTEFTAVEVFNNEEKFLARIEGDATGGTLSLTNQSSMRRTGSLNLLVPEYERGMYGMDIMHEVTNMETLISMNKIVRVWKGIENTELAFSTFNADGTIKEEVDLAHLEGKYKLIVEATDNLDNYVKNKAIYPID